MEQTKQTRIFAKQLMPETRFFSDVPDAWPSAPMREHILANRSFWKGKRALVTGAFGFLGGHLCRALFAADAIVCALDCDTSERRYSQLNATDLREHLEIVEADITDRDAMEKLLATGEFDFVFHLAAGATVIEKALENPHETILANTMGFVNLAEGARRLPEAKRPVILYSSTDKVYGEAKTLPYTEDSDLGGAGVYDSAKLCGDIFAGMYHKALGVPTIVLRMCNLFGPYDYNIDYRLMPKTLRNIFRDGEGPEMYANALEHFRDYIYVEDAARAFMMLAERENCRGRVYNLPGALHAATPDVLSSLVGAVAQLQDEEMASRPNSTLAKLKWHRSVRVTKSDPKLIVISKQNLDGSRISEEAGFEPKISFRDGLQNTVRFYAWLFCHEAKQSHTAALPALAKTPAPSFAGDFKRKLSPRKRGEFTPSGRKTKRLEPAIISAAQ